MLTSPARRPSISCDAHEHTRLASLLNFQAVHLLYAVRTDGNDLIRRRVPVTDLHHNILGHINVWRESSSFRFSLQALITARHLASALG